MDITSIPEIYPFVCGSCNSQIFSLKIAKEDNGTVLLMVTCGNEKCVEERRLELGAPTNELLVWAEYDITNSYEGTDFNLSTTPTNIN